MLVTYPGITVASSPTKPASYRSKSFILLVDVTGELAAWWGLATVAFVGGSLDGRTRRPKHARACCIRSRRLLRAIHTKLSCTEVSELLQSRGCCCCSRWGGTYKISSLSVLLIQCIPAKIGTYAQKLIEKKQGGTKLTAFKDF